MSNQLSEMENRVFSYEKPFNQVNAYKLNFKKEATFALQLLKASDYLMSAAKNSPDSLQSAITNIAAIGISLNPATKEAYLVPRKSKKDSPVQICLDISAIGLIKLATDSGSIKWAQAEVVKKNDKFKFLGVGQTPLHEVDYFGERGETIGTYVVAKTADGDFLTTVMSVKECHEIRDRSEAWKAFKAGKTFSCPWQSDEGEMMKKTAIKRASKLWPKSERLDTAVHVINEHEGIDFEAEKTPTHLKIASTDLIDEKSVKNIRDLLALKGKSEEYLLEFMNNQFNYTTDEKKLKKIEDFNSTHSDFAYRLINSAEKK